MNGLLALPLAVPLGTAVVTLLLARHRRAQRVVSISGALGLLGSSVGLLHVVRRHGVVALQVGEWPAPFGISLVGDLLGATMVVIAGIIGSAVTLYSMGAVGRDREPPAYHPMLHFLLTGVCGAFLTGDIFNLYVWFEVMLTASFVLLALGGTRPQMDAAIKYLTLNLLASGFFLAGIGILYGIAGTLNIAHLSVLLQGTDRPDVVMAAAPLFLLAFGIKAAAFPLFFWLPDSYHTVPARVGALFAGLLTKVGVYALIRTFTLLFVRDPSWTGTLLLIVAGLTMVTGVLGAAVQMDFRRVLSFHIVSQIGYMIMGLALGTPLGIAAAVFFTAHNIIAKSNLFLIAGVVQRLRGTQDLSRLGGLYDEAPLLSALFLIAALGLSGIPPLSGFFAKLFLVRAGLEADQPLIVAVALAVGFMTLYSMTKIWQLAFWRERPGDAERGAPGNARMLVPIATLATLTVWMGLGGQWLFELSIDTADQLLDSRPYVEAVLGKTP